MMKKFEESLDKRINELKDKQEKFIEIKNNHGRATHFREKCLNLSIKYGEIVTELEKTLNHFRQSVEAQSVADGECEKEYCDCPGNPDVFMDYYINAQRCTKCGKET